MLVGESNIISLLDEIHKRLTGEDDQKGPFVGYYSKKESLIAVWNSNLSFSIVLKSLIDDVKESQHLYEKVDSTMAKETLSDFLLTSVS